MSANINIGKTIPTDSLPPKIPAIIGTIINPAPDNPVFAIPIKTPQKMNNIQVSGVVRK
jgi:hypothetical protein